MGGLALGPKTLLAERGGLHTAAIVLNGGQIIIGRHNGPQGVEIWKCFPEEEGFPVLEDMGTCSIRLVDKL